MVTINKKLYITPLQIIFTAFVPAQKPLENTDALWEAASIKALLKQGVDPNSKAQTGHTILMIAAYKRHLEIINQLIKANYRDQ